MSDTHKEKYVTIKVRPQTAMLLRQLRDATGLTILSLLDRMVLEAVSNTPTITATYIPEAKVAHADS